MTKNCDPKRAKFITAISILYNFLPGWFDPTNNSLSGELPPDVIYPDYVFITKQSGKEPRLLKARSLLRTVDSYTLEQSEKDQHCLAILIGINC